MITDEEEAIVMEMLVRRAKILAVRKVRVNPYNRGKDYDGNIKHILAAGKKICTKCLQEKSLEEFSVTKIHPTGTKSECKACASLRWTKYRQRDPEGMRIKDRISHYKNKYGMTLEEATNLVEDRTGLCESCRRVEPLVVDHDHETNQKRGMICNRCNRALGLVLDDPDTLYGLIEYLARAKENAGG